MRCVCVCGSCFDTSESVCNAVIKPIGFGNNLPIQPTPVAPSLLPLAPVSSKRLVSDLFKQKSRQNGGAFPTYALSPGWCSNLSSDVFLQKPIKPQQWPACHQLDTVYWVHWSKILCPGSLLTDLVSTPYHPGAQEKSVTFCDFSVLEPALLPQPCHLSFSSAWQPRSDPFPSPLWCWPSLDIWYSVNLISGVVRGWSR